MDTKTNLQLTCLPRGQIEAALGAATSFLARWQDCFTSANREELGQDAVVLALTRWPTLRDKGRFHAFVRTIARRRRAAALGSRARLPTVSIDANWHLADQVVAPMPEQEEFRIAGDWVPRDELIAALPSALDRLTRLNAALLMGYYEGFTCGELAARHELTSENVKVRIHRARRRVRELLRRHLKRKAVAGDPGPGSLEENSQATTEAGRRSCFPPAANQVKEK